MLGAKFTCNICGTHQAFQPAGDWREFPSCSGCGSSVRMRSMVHCLVEGLTGKGQVLSAMAPSAQTGAGLSDWDGYAIPLAQKFAYTNTYYHQEPRLDICAPGKAWIGACDFLLTSDVFEHTPPPAIMAFEGAFQVLKPGGLLVLTVPFGGNSETIEHYPELHEFKVVELGGDYAVVNRAGDGKFTLHTDPVFHGGPGTTLEMRIFSRADTIAKLEEAGFIDIEVHEAAVPEWGVFPPHGHGLPITARKPGPRAQVGAARKAGLLDRLAKKVGLRKP